MRQILGKRGVTNGSSWIQKKITLCRYLIRSILCSKLEHIVKNINIREISYEEALKVWNNSNEAGCFTNPKFLKSVNYNVQYWGGIKGEEILCAWPILKDKKGLITNLPFCYYIGPIWSKTLTELPPYRLYATSQKIYANLIEKILSLYPKISLSLPIGKIDLRAFTWWNYGKKNQPKFKIELRYSALIKNLKNKSNKEIVDLFRPDDKRKTIKKLIKNHPPIHITSTVSKQTIIKLYESTIQRTGGLIENKDLEVLEKIIDYSLDGNGKIICFAENNSSEVVAAQVMLDCKNITNAIAQGLKSDWHDSDLSVFLNYHSILSARDRGSDIYDFNGANSPNRADDKHAYGAEFMPYFDLSFLL